MRFKLIILLLLSPLIAWAAEPTVLINEIAWMGTSISANDEWLELYNPTSNDIDLAGFRLEADDGSPKIELTGKIPASGYFLLERTDDDTVPEITADLIYTGSLGNTGEWLKLYDSQGQVIDEINATAGWPGGNNETKQTLERADQNNWQTSELAGGTPKSVNGQPAATTTPESITEESADNQTSNSNGTTQPTTEPNIPKGSIIFNEIFPNPLGIDQNEFIELKNISQNRIDLTSWKITNINKQAFTFPSLSLMPNSIVTFNRQQTGLVLNNFKEKLTLYSKPGKIIDEATYKSEAPENQSYQKNNVNKWQWFIISPDQENLAQEEVLPIAIINGPKTAGIGEIITFDTSDSLDPQNRPLSFLWDFGDGRTDTGIIVRQIYLKAGNYDIVLKAAADQSASSTEKLKIKVTGETKKIITENTPTTTPATTDEPAPLVEIPFIFISEFLPNPEGPDDQGEFIEIFSQHNSPVNLAGWQLDDIEGGSKPYTIPDGIIIKPGQFLAFFRPQTKIALNNSDETIRLLAPDGTIVDATSYEESKEGISFVLDEQFSWQQTKTPTPGEINVLDTSEKEQETSVQETTTPKILGAQLNQKDLPAGQPANKTKYIFAGISALVVLGAGAALKIRKKG